MNINVIGYREQDKDGVRMIKVSLLYVFLFIYFFFTPGHRGKRGKEGPIEQTSQKLIKAAAAGDQQTVHSLLMQGAVNVNVADKHGHTALLGAAVRHHLNFFIHPK